MGEFRRHQMSRAVLSGLTLAAFVLLGGCADMSRSPFGPGGGVAIEGGGAQAVSSESPFTIGFSREAAPFAGKRAKERDNSEVESALQTLSASGTFTTRRGGKLEVKFPQPRDRNSFYVEKVKFEVKRGSIDRTCEITMKVTAGDALEDLEIEFTPSGVVFDPPAEMAIYLKGVQHLDAVVYHITGDGESTEAKIVTDGKGKKGWKITVAVPGFSRYSLGGDDMLADQMGQNIMVMFP